MVGGGLMYIEESCGKNNYVYISYKSIRIKLLSMKLVTLTKKKIKPFPI